MSEIEPGLENDHPVERPVREGLPPNYRMRADTHYVEQLDTNHPSPVRFIEAFVDNLDLAVAGFVRVQPKATGRPGYAPADLLKLYI